MSEPVSVTCSGGHTPVASILKRLVGEPVLDETGLSGHEPVQRRGRHGHAQMEPRLAGASLVAAGLHGEAHEVLCDGRQDAAGTIDLGVDRTEHRASLGAAQAVDAS